MRAAALAAALAATAAACATSAPASAAGAASTWSGTCHLSGHFTFDQPLGVVPRATTFDDYEAGTCDGVLDGVAQRGVGIVLRSEGVGVLGCAAGHSTAAGTITFTESTGRQVKLGFSNRVEGAETEYLVRFHGGISGGGVGESDFLPFSSPAQVAECEAGTLRSADVDLVTRTVRQMAG